MSKEEINKLLKDNPIKIIKFDDIEVPVEWLKQSTVNINGDDYIKLQQENKQLRAEKEELKKWLEEQKQFIEDIPTFSNDIKNNHIGMVGAYQNTLDKIKELEEGVKE